MGIISWDKPRKIHSTKDHNEMYSSDCDVPGTYMPNMSKDDIKKWKGRVVGAKIGSPQVEIRKNYMLVIVSLGGGYQHKFYTREKTVGINLHISMAGPTQLTFQDWDDMKAAVDEARQKLEALARGES